LTDAKMQLIVTGVKNLDSHFNKSMNGIGFCWTLMTIVEMQQPHGMHRVLNIAGIPVRRQPRNTMIKPSQQAQA
jgi:hypothetical protein